MIVIQFSVYGKVKREGVLTKTKIVERTLNDNVFDRGDIVGIVV